MAIAGLKKIRFSLKDANGNLLTGANGLSASGIYEVNEDAVTGNVTGMNPTVTAKYGSNGVRRNSVGLATPSVALEFLDMDFDVKQKLLGRVSDAKGGYVQSQQLPVVAMEIVTQSIDRKSDIIVAFGAGTVTEAGLNAGTDTNNATESNDQLTFTAQSFEAWGGQMYKLYNTADEKYVSAEADKEVFGVAVAG